MVVGHADIRGPKKYNQALSERRAEAAKNYLVSQGIPADKIETKSEGEDRPTDRTRGGEPSVAGFTAATCLDEEQEEGDMARLQPPRGRHPGADRTGINRGISERCPGCARSVAAACSKRSRQWKLRRRFPPETKTRNSLTPATDSGIGVSSGSRPRQREGRPAAEMRLCPVPGRLISFRNQGSRVVNAKANIF